uniref:Fas-associated death domain protein n=1 Tax=Plautia stali TaxID=106108 RepID=A0A499U6E7_PLAST|nr:fas-associated death domain protein [Plautia stali]
MVLISYYNMENQRFEIVEENYRNIFQMLCQVKLSEGKLELIKSKFKDNINSPRRYENINTMEELLKILEKRCVIGFDNIVKLYDIVETLDDVSKQKIGKNLNNQSLLLSRIPKAPINLAFCQDKQMCSSIPEFSLPVEVTDYISSSIKRYWQNFARALQIIHEKEIDLIEEYNGDRTKKCLEIFVHEANCQRLSNPYGTLLNALEMIKRRDVKEHVENLLLLRFKRS